MLPKHMASARITPEWTSKQQQALVFTDFVNSGVCCCCTAGPGWHGGGCCLHQQRQSVPEPELCQGRALCLSERGPLLPQVRQDVPVQASSAQVPGGLPAHSASTCCHGAKSRGGQPKHLLPRCPAALCALYDCASLWDITVAAQAASVPWYLWGQHCSNYGSKRALVDLRGERCTFEHIGGSAGMHACLAQGVGLQGVSTWLQGLACMPCLAGSL